MQNNVYKKEYFFKFIIGHKYFSCLKIPRFFTFKNLNGNSYTITIFPSNKQIYWNSAWGRQKTSFTQKMSTFHHFAEYTNLILVMTYDLQTLHNKVIKTLSDVIIFNIFC